MFTQDKNVLSGITSKKRIWQGIPSIERTKNGRIFVTFYSGGIKEQIGNYCLLLTGDESGNFSEPIAAAMPDDGYRFYDPCLWIDPDGRLWFTWSVYPDDALWAVVCDDPDTDELKFGEAFVVGHNVMMNKPIVLESGEWVFPVAVWKEGSVSVRNQVFCGLKSGAFAYVTKDHGKTFEKRGGADIPERNYDEHMILEQNDHSLTVFVRQMHGQGIGTARSYDGGYTWTEVRSNALEGPGSRFHIRRLPSGRILLINHYDFTKRNNLTALLSEDDGRTWRYKLLLDARNDVSYPDVTLDNDGNIYVVYDRERGAFKRNLDDALSSAREILMAKIREEDIVSGKIVCETSFLCRTVSKLKEYTGDEDKFYQIYDQI